MTKMLSDRSGEILYLCTRINNEGKLTPDTFLFGDTEFPFVFQHALSSGYSSSKVEVGPNVFCFAFWPNAYEFPLVVNQVEEIVKAGLDVYTSLGKR